MTSCATRHAIEDKIAQAQLSALVSDLAGQVDAGDAVKASRTLRLARRALARLNEGVRVNGTDAADLGAVALVLDQADALVSESNSGREPTNEKLLP